MKQLIHYQAYGFYLGYFLLGFAMACAIVVTIVHQSNWNMTSVIGFGPDFNKEVIEGELGPVIVHYGGGHDGQLFYLIARDPFGKLPQYTGFSGDKCYRFRRILYPLLGGGVGFLNGKATLYGLILLSAIGLGLAVLSQRVIAERWGVGNEATLFILANPGVWFGVAFLTADTLALGLSLAAVACWLGDRRCMAIALFAGSILTKEYYLVTPMALALDCLIKRRVVEGILLGTLPLLPLLLWNFYLTSQFGCRSTAQTLNDFIPFQGILAAMPIWTRFLDPLHLFPTVFMVIGLGVGILGLVKLKDSTIRLILLGWLLLAISSPVYIWALGNNSSRSFLALWSFGGIALLKLFHGRNCI